MINTLESSKVVYENVCYNLLLHSINYLSEIQILPQTLSSISDRVNEANIIYLKENVSEEIKIEEESKEKLLTILKKIQSSKSKSNRTTKARLINTLRNTNIVSLKNTEHNNSINYEKFRELNNLNFVELLTRFKMIGLYYLLNPIYKCVDSLDRLFSEGQVKDISDYLELICKYLKLNSKKTNEKILYNHFNDANEDNKIVKIKLL
jgi:hypothetical protein